uniref:7TM_GPCR_Srx domain-containing protein n=1 Tax=Wuchereria bancrofti TaxID=6293 RepID=A0A1I8EEI5_WUCBA
MRRNTTESTVSDINEKEVLFFKQSCKLGLLYISCAVTYNIPSYLLIDKWMLFISSTIAVLLAHSLDGLIFLVFNRKLICKTNFDGIAPATNFQDCMHLNN